MFCPQMLEEFAISNKRKSIFTWVRNQKADIIFFINIYAPNKTYEAIDFYENLRTTLVESDYDQDYKFITGGDFNAPLSLQSDSYGSKTE